MIWPHVAWRAATLMRHRYCQEAAYESHELAAIDKKLITLDKAQTIWTAYPRQNDTASNAALCEIYCAAQRIELPRGSTRVTISDAVSSRIKIAD